MKNYNNLKVKLRTIPDKTENWYFVQYKIIPSELPWYKRNPFFNPWRKLYGFDFYGDMAFSFFFSNKYVIEEFLNKFKTVNDLNHYMNNN